MGNSRQTLLIVLVLIQLLAPVPSRVESAPGGDAGPNVLLVTIDTLRFDRVSFHDGRHAQTPNLDKLARRSLVFTRAFAHNPVTLPSHANILTGTTPLFHGISDNTGFRLGGRARRWPGG